MSRIEVELVEPEPGSEGPEQGVPTSTDRGWARRRRALWWLAAGVVLLVAVAAGVQHVVESRRIAHVTRFDHVPGVLVPLSASVALAEMPAVDPWRLDQAGPLAVAWTTDATSATLTAYDRATAQQAWSTTVELSPTTAAAARLDDVPAQVLCRALGEPGTAGWGEHLVCSIEPGTTSFPVTDPWQLVVLRTSDGAVLDEREPATEAWTTAGDLVVTAAADRDDDGAETWTVSATRASGETAWTWEAGTAVERDGPTYSASLHAGPDGTMLSVHGRWWVLGGDGELVREGGAPGTAAWPSRGGAVIERPVVVVEESGDVPSRDDLTLVGTEGSQELTGADELTLRVDDGSAPQVVLLTAGRLDGTGADHTLVARSATTAQVVWTRELAVSSSLLLEGRLYVCTEDDLWALDASDGSTLWRVERTSRWSSCDLATDGRTVITVDEAFDLHARDLEDGAARWTASFGAGFRRQPYVLDAGLVVDSPQTGPTSLLVPDPELAFSGS